MGTKWWIRFGMFLSAILISVFLIIPTFFPMKEDSAYPVKSKINLGLDLQGGLYMILGIDFNKVYKDEVSNLIRKAVDDLNSKGIKAELGETLVNEISDPKQQIILANASDQEKAEQEIKSFYTGRSYLRLTGEEGPVLTYGLHNFRKNEIEAESVSKSIEVIRNRIDEFGVTEPEITSQGKDRIVVQLPGVKDIDRAKSLIGQTAKLEFRMVNTEIPPSTINTWLEKAEKEKGLKFEKGQKFSTYIQALNQFLKDDIPKDYTLVFEKQTNAKGEISQMVPYLVSNDVKLTGDDLQDASVQFDPEKQQPFVSMTFKSRGATIFADLTAANVGKPMAIVLDGNVNSAPTINERIGGGRASITLGASGNSSGMMQEASDLALVLRAGALPVQLEFQEQRIVGPQLGEDSIVAAEKSAIIGMVMIFLFIFIYYKISGLIALSGLTFNLVIVLAALVMFGATLTLPGIAGIALTIGMAIDASIIIFERIREEVRKGENNFQAVEKGFQTAFWTIFDANITTALAGFCLLNFGTGPIRGFAVTLLIGIVATIYTSYFVGALLFQLYMNKVQGKSLSI